mmetsp:Transcript_12133/g.20091  ORF Transcript_12133/g.20091 Transcript_12133/m.20091 type:complete len:81 (-) Transcript_12133:252-494(-)|eukprot:CAMPEP_0174990120 /NCGR_PEP_ID=MMETSP0004_2-20121128/21130_1 /TAXON_ID=420556 /ORGANISM="Ochromonas sp., Strain CCMP1393" /LENGTH=80 /DNA_ID=CAMNT_0016243663 /DNA_START=88 /DNA_END=330 /DNA_ORIENTATION=+
MPTGTGIMKDIIHCVRTDVTQTVAVTNMRGTSAADLDTLMNPAQEDAHHHEHSPNNCPQRLLEYVTCKSTKGQFQCFLLN